MYVEIFLGAEQLLAHCSPPAYGTALLGVFQDSGNSARFSACRYSHGSNHSRDVKDFEGHIFLKGKLLWREQCAFKEKFWVFLMIHFRHPFMG